MEYYKNMFATPTPAAVFPTLIVLLLLVFFIYYIKAMQQTQGTAEWIHTRVNKTGLTLINRRFPMELKDLVPLASLTLIFLFLALYNLGDTNRLDVIDEIQVPAVERTHMDNLYFDEIFFVRTAVEHIESMNPYENTHPPLGKELIAASILTFGESPFGWRILGAISGVLMLSVMYIFIKNIFGKTLVAVCGTLLFGFDFMRFVQTRLGTVDAFLILFFLLAFFFMYRYITTDADMPIKKSLAPLALCGLFFGLSCTVKWIGFYAGAGLFILYIIRLVQLGKHYMSTSKSGFGMYLLKTLFCSLLFFIIISALIYYLTYIPYGLARGMSLSRGMLWDPDFLGLVWSNQVSMFNYHSQLVAEHTFSSVWWQWIFNIRPILYVNDAFGDLRARFGAFGNPVVWWGGFIAMIIMAVRVFTHRDGKALFILIGYLTPLLPWVAVTRVLFAYHYFPSVLFIILALSHIFNSIIEKQKNSGVPAIIGYTAVTGSVFAVFYPSLSGMYMPQWYYSNVIRWFSTWPF